MRNDRQGGRVEGQSKLMATAKAIEDLGTMIDVRKQAAKGGSKRRRQTTRSAGKRPKGKRRPSRHKATQDKKPEHKQAQ